MDRDSIKTLLLTSDRAVERALVVLHSRQTSDERATSTTSHCNGRGFNAFDAEFGSSLARQVEQGRTLSDRQLQYARRIALRYVGQLLQVAQEKAAAAATV